MTAPFVLTAHEDLSLGQDMKVDGSDIDDFDPVSAYTVCLCHNF